MPENPISDVIEFLTNPSWPTPVFWLLVIASVGIAILIWHRRPDQQDFSYLVQWSFRFRDGRLLVPAEPVKAAAAVHQPSRGTADDGPDLLDAADGPVRRDS